MEELVKYYEKQLATFAELHKRYVQSNKNKNALCLAKEQMRTVGDTHIDYALEVVENALKDERRRNDELVYQVNCLSGYLLDMEYYIKNNFNVKLNGVSDVRGY